MPKHVFGVHHTHGPHAINRGGTANLLVRFRFRRQRDRWVAQDPDKREAIDSRHPYVRLSQRRPAWDGDIMRIAD